MDASEEVKVQKKKVAAYIVMAAVIVCMLSPFSWLILSSINVAPTVGIALPEDFTFAHFRRAFAAEPLQWITNSLIIAFSTATIVLLMSVFAAYPFSRFKFPGSNAILMFFVFLRVFPMSAFLVPLYIVLADIGLVNTHVGVILALAIVNLPVPILLMKSFYDTVPISYEESAWVDGQSKVRSILGVLLPICTPGMAVIWITTFLAAWAEFLLPFVILREMRLFPLSVGLYTAWSLHGVVDYGLVSSLSIVFMLPPLAIYLFGRRWLLRGLSGLTLR